jgi:hypothetical protein
LNIFPPPRSSSPPSCPVLEGALVSADVTPQLDPGDAVSEPHEVIHMELDRNELPTEGEWKRALTNRTVFEQAFVVKLGEVDNPEPGGQFSLTHPIRGERIIAVPAGAIGVGFIWEIGGTKQ